MFARVDLGDVLLIYLDNSVTEYLIVLTNADDDTVTVEDAIDLTNSATFSYRKFVCGTADTDGWIPVHGKGTVMMGFQYDAGDVTAAAMTMECMSGALGAQSVRVYPGISSDCGDGTLNGKVCEFTTVGDRISYKMTDNAFAFCRLGVAWVSADGGTRDEITAVIDVGP